MLQITTQQSKYYCHPFLKNFPCAFADRHIIPDTTLPVKWSWDWTSHKPPPSRPTVSSIFCTLEAANINREHSHISSHTPVPTLPWSTPAKLSEITKNRQMKRIISIEKPFADRGICSSFSAIQPQEQTRNRKQAKLEETVPSVGSNLRPYNESTNQIIPCEKFLLVVMIDMKDQDQDHTKDAPIAGNSQKH